MSINVCNDRSMASITSLPSGVTGSSLVLLETQTASSSATISFTSNINSTYKEYQFHFIDIHPSADGADFTFNMSTDSGSNYNVTKTSTNFIARLDEDNSDAQISYIANNDLAQGTGFQIIGDGVGADNDQSGSGQLFLFNPSSTTFVKHFISNFNGNRSSDANFNVYVGGYGNTTSAIDAVQFKFASGNIDSGTIKMYGVV